MDYLKKLSSFVVTILLIISIFSGAVAAAEPNTQETEFFLNEDFEFYGIDDLIPEHKPVPNDTGNLIEDITVSDFVEEEAVFQLMQARSLILTPEMYGNPSVVEINTKQELLDEILNALGTKEVDGFGNRIKTTYKLMDDFEVNASELDNTHFRYQYHANAGTLFSNIDGNGKTITIVVDTPDPSRPLLNRINDVHNTTSQDRLFVKNLTIKYINGTYQGDVKVSPFVNGQITFCDLENITIEVEGNIVADYRLYTETSTYENHSKAYGLADYIVTIVKMDDNGVVYDSRGQTLYEPVILQDIEITAKTLGYIPGKTPEIAGGWLGYANGLAVTTGIDVMVDNVTLNYKRIDATSQWSSIASGFTEFSQGLISNVTINIEEDIIADGQIRGGPTNEANGYAQIIGIAGTGSRLKDSSITVGGNMTAVCHENGTPVSAILGASIVGISEISDSSTRYYNGAEYINNSVTVYGNVTGRAPSRVYITGGIENQLGDSTKYPRFSKDNIVIVYGDIEAVVEQTMVGSYGTTQSLITGMSSGLSESINDTAIIYGNVTSYCQNGASLVFGHTWATRGYTSLYDGLVEVHGVMSSVSDKGSSSVTGMNYGMIGEHSGNKMFVFNEWNEPHGIYSETHAVGGLNAQSYGYGGSVSNTTSMILSNNTVYVNGNITAKAPEIAVASGMLYSFSTAFAGSALTDNIVFVDGKIYTEAENTTATTGVNGYNGFAYSSGFITFAGREIKQNAIYARDGISTNVTTGNGFAAGFSLSTNNISQIYENTWLGKPGKSSTPPAQGVDASYEDFIISTNADARIGGNFYTSVLEGQRVTNELMYNSTAFYYEPVSSDKQPLMEVSATTDYSAGSEYILEADTEIGTLGFAGTDASKASLSGNDLTLPENAFVMVTAYEGNKRTVKDIPGIGSSYLHGDISGTIFIDLNDDGNPDSGEEAANVVVKAYYENEEVSSAVTDGNGDYQIRIPLLTVQNPDLVLRIVCPDGQQSSSHINNIFGTANELPVNLYWTEPEALTGYGILSGTSGYTVQFDSQGGAPVLSITGVSDGDLITSPASPSRTGFIFNGWFNESECVNPWDFSSDTVSGNMTLYANWENAYTVIFDSQGGSTVNPVTGIMENKLISEPASPYKSGARFDGWYKEAECLNPWDFNTDLVTDNIVLYAKWIHLYTMTFDPRGGNVVAPYGDIPEGSSVNPLPTPTRSNSASGNRYVFSGWFKEPEYINQWDVLSDTVTKDVTLYAKWTNTYKVNYTVSGGTPQPTNLTGTSTVLHGSTLTAPSMPTKGTDSFGGWFKEPECINEWIFATDTVTENTVLYAKWTGTTPSTHTVTFNSQGATSNIPSTLTNVVSGSPISKPSNPSKTGSTFGGWFNESDCINEWIFATDTVTSDMTLYAKWTFTNGAVFFDTQGGLPASMKVSGIVKGSFITPPDPIPTRGNDVLEGWYKEPGCINEWDFATDTVSDYETFLYAKWSSTYTVSFNSQGGTNIPAVSGIESGNKVTEPSVPVRGTDTFEGWYKEPSCLNVWDFSADTVAEDLTLYAKWQPTYTVTFEANGGMPVPLKLTGVKSNSLVSEPSAPSKENFTFEGWYKEPTCLTQWDFAIDQITSHTVLYAKWTPGNDNENKTTPGGGGGSGTGSAKVIGGSSEYGEAEIKDNGDSGSGGKPIEPMEGYDEEVRISWILIIFLFLLAIIIFIYRRKKEKDEEDADLENMNRFK